MNRSNIFEQFEMFWLIVHSSVGKSRHYTHTCSVVFLCVFNLFEVLLGFQYCNMCAIPKRKSWPPYQQLNTGYKRGTFVKNKKTDTDGWTTNDKILDLSTPYLSFHNGGYFSKRHAAESTCTTYYYLQYVCI